MKRVCVMMSSYNGEAFISRQLDTIWEQQNVIVDLYIRDDGSKDDTKRIIQEYYEKFPDNMYVVWGENIGWKRSFLTLIYDIVGEKKYDYYCIADQDDYWDRNKLDAAIKKIDNSKNEPCLYASNLELVDINLTSKGYLYTNSKDDFKILEQLFMLGSSPFGCTMVWNYFLQKILLRGRPDIDVSYDQWVHMVARCEGSVCVDYKSHIKHIIHGNNACGVSKNQVERIKKFFRLYMTPQYVRSSDMIKEYFKIYGNKSKNSHIALMEDVIKRNIFSIFAHDEILRLKLMKKMRIIMFFLIGKL